MSPSYVMVAVIMMAMILPSVSSYDDYTFEPRLLTAGQWNFEKHNDPSNNGVGSNVGSCYNDLYTYYTNFMCDTSVLNCANALSYCNTLVDPADQVVADAINARNRTLAIALPCAIGGFLLLSCCCGCCICYYSYSYYDEYKAKQLRKKNKKGGR